MNVKLLIDAIIRQTMVLIAQLSTTAGLRAPLAHVANQIFLDLVTELESQGVGRKVIADMFGLALRSYQIKVQRLSESSTEQNRSLWEAVLGHLQDKGMASRAEVLIHFRLDDESVVRSILHDLVESGLIFKSGRGHSTVYRAASPEELGRTLAGDDPGRSAAALVWVAVYRSGPATAEAITRHLNIEAELVDEALTALVAEGRVARIDGSDGGAVQYTCETCIIPLGEPSGWEAAVFDHYQAMVSALCTKLRRGDTVSLPQDVIGGSTWSFDVWKGHPHEEKVYALLGEIRHKVSTLRTEVTTYNTKRGRPSAGIHKVIFYAGQTVVIDTEEEHEDPS